MDAQFGRAVGAMLAFDNGMGAFVDGFEIANGSAWTKVERNGDLFPAPACERGPCRVRYRVRLQDAARTLSDRGVAFASGDVVLAPPSSRLARPLRDEQPGRYRFRVALPEGVSFATGVFRLEGTADTYEAETADLSEAPYSAFGPLENARVQANGGVVEVAIPSGEQGLATKDVVDWVERSARAVAGYYGTFPVPRAQVIVLPGGRRPVGFGTTLGNGGASIVVWLGKGATPEQLASDWVLVHGMTHLGFPERAARPALDGGGARDVRGADRAGPRGLLAETEVWRGLVEGLPPEPAGRERAPVRPLGQDLLGRRAVLVPGGPGHPRAHPRAPVRGRRAARDPRGWWHHSGELARGARAGDGRPRDRHGRAERASTRAWARRGRRRWTWTRRGSGWAYAWAPTA